MHLLTPSKSGDTKYKANIVENFPQGTWLPDIGSNFSKFSIQWVNIMNNREKLTESHLVSLGSYLAHLDVHSFIGRCHELIEYEKSDDPPFDRLVKAVGEHPSVLVRLLLLYAYLRGPDGPSASAKGSK